MFGQIFIAVVLVYALLVSGPNPFYIFPLCHLQSPSPYLQDCTYNLPFPPSLISFDSKGVFRGRGQSPAPQISQKGRQKKEKKKDCSENAPKTPHFCTYLGWGKCPHKPRTGENPVVPPPL